MPDLLGQPGCSAVLVAPGAVPSLIRHSSAGHTRAASIFSSENLQQERAETTYLMRCTPRIEPPRPHTLGKVKCVKQQSSDVGHDGGNECHYKSASKPCSLTGTPMSTASHRDGNDIPQNLAAARPCIQNNCKSGANMAKFRKRKKAIRHGYRVSYTPQPMSPLLDFHCLIRVPRTIGNGHDIPSCAAY